MQLESALWQDSTPVTFPSSLKLMSPACHSSRIWNRLDSMIKFIVWEIQLTCIEPPFIRVLVVQDIHHLFNNYILLYMIVREVSCVANLYWVFV